MAHKPSPMVIASAMRFAAPSHSADEVALGEFQSFCNQPMPPIWRHLSQAACKTLGDGIMAFRGMSNCNHVTMCVTAMCRLVFCKTMLAIMRNLMSASSSFAEQGSHDLMGHARKPVLGANSTPPLQILYAAQLFEPKASALARLIK